MEDRVVGIVGVVVATALVVGSAISLAAGAVESEAMVATVGTALDFSCMADGNGTGAESGDVAEVCPEPLPRNPKNAPMPMNPTTRTAPAAIIAVLLDEPRGELVCPSGIADVSDASTVEPIADVA